MWLLGMWVTFVVGGFIVYAAGSLVDKRGRK